MAKGQGVGSIGARAGASGVGFGSGGAVGGSGGGTIAENIIEAVFADDFNLDVDLTCEEGIADNGSKKKTVEMRVIDEEKDDEQLVDYSSKPEFYELDERPMTYVAQRSSAE